MNYCKLHKMLLYDKELDTPSSFAFRMYRDGWMDVLADKANKHGVCSDIA